MHRGSHTKRGGFGHGVARGLGLLGLALAVGCGGGGDNGGTPPTPVRSLIQQGNFSLASVADANAAGLAFDAGRTDFSTSGSGSLEVSVDWTFSSNAVGFGVYQGACTYTAFYANSCNQVSIVQLTNTKPARLTIASLPAGAYTLMIVNGGPGAESGTYQIFLTR